MDFGRLQYHQRFDELCKQLLFLIYPELKTVDGRGGDEGTDSFIGTINRQKCIFQFKYFQNNLTNSNWTKIRKSLHDASLKKPKKWILLISSDFTRSDWKKWEELKQQYASIKLEVMNEPKLKNKILKYQVTLAPEFTELFPSSVAKPILKYGRLIVRKQEQQMHGGIYNDRRYFIEVINTTPNTVAKDCEGFIDLPETQIRNHKTVWEKNGLGNINIGHREFLHLFEISVFTNESDKEETRLYFDYLGTHLVNKAAEQEYEDKLDKKLTVSIQSENANFPSGSDFVPKSIHQIINEAVED